MFRQGYCNGEVVFLCLRGVILNALVYDKSESMALQWVIYNRSVVESPQRALVNDSIAHEG